MVRASARIRSRNFIHPLLLKSIVNVRISKPKLDTGKLLLSIYVDLILIEQVLTWCFVLLAENTGNTDTAIFTAVYYWENQV